MPKVVRCSAGSSCTAAHIHARVRDHAILVLWRRVKRLRLRLFAVAGRITSSGRRLRLRIAERWPWAAGITTAAARLQAIGSG